MYITNICSEGSVIANTVSTYIIYGCFPKAIGREEAKKYVCVYVVLYNTYNYYQLHN